MNKSSLKIITIILCVILCLSGVLTASALTSDKNEEPKGTFTTISTEYKDEEICKDETVYILAGTDGAVKKIIVSDWIKNALGASSLTDTTGLSNIENVKGDETYTADGNTKVWDAQGNDIYYQGNIEKELPVRMAVTYMLDGKKVSADEIAGKTGKVSIRFDYDNRQYKTVKINGKNEKIYVPFAMLTGMLFDNDCFRNVQVSNGKLINDGDHTAIVGIAFPGLQENLGISKDKIDIPNYVEITADATDFSLGMTVTIATNELFNNLDSSKFDSTDGLIDSIKELADGMNQLIDGSAALYEGATAVDSGADQLKAGAVELASGLNALKDNNATLSGGARQVFETLLSTAEGQIKAGGVSIPPLTIENYAQVLGGIIDTLGASEGAKSIISLKASLDSYNAFYLGLMSYTDGVGSAADGANKLVLGASDLKNGTAQLKDGAMQLNAGLKKFNEEGITKIIDLVDGDLNGIVACLKATIDVSKNYHNFAGISDDMSGRVKFIYRTDEIKSK